MKAAIIGTGLIANTHVQALQSLGQDVAAVVNRNQERGEAFARKWNIPSCTTSFADALSDEIQVVHICTPPALHYDMIKAALMAGKHVVCEKPMCIEPQRARELTKLAQEKGRIGAVVFNVRFHEASQHAKAKLADSAFGPIRLVHGSYLQEFHALPDYYSWRYQPELAGPMRALTEIGSHWIDLVHYWTGLEITAVSAQFGAFDPERKLREGMMHRGGEGEQLEVSSEDAAMLSLRFSNGAIGNVVLSEISHGRSNRLQLEITGTQQSLWWNNEQPYQLHLGEKFHGFQTLTFPFGDGFGRTFQACFAAIYADIERGETSPDHPYATFEDGYRNAAVCMAAYRSAQEDGKWRIVMDNVK
ncbi:MAG: Gfo/Idh/MocA family oxidoreductase [Saprospiraceae bacterium]|nr:Gfo/Idh/MocA family oxidoreductase [Saprospiraceae bacterium]